MSSQISITYFMVVSFSCELSTGLTNGPAAKSTDSGNLFGGPLP